jgi:DNA processing protein
MAIDPVFEPRATFEALRGERGFDAAASGLWQAGSLAGLARPCVAIVGTRAATGYGRRLAHQFAADLGAAGCCIVSGLALGIDAAAHEGALAAGAPTVGVLGCGHGRFFPRRNLLLAERNGIVAALADAVLVIEAPARSGALNTAGWAAGKIPVLAVPGDVDRAHVAGCHALIRDGATLARHAGDVLEALGRHSQLALLPPNDPCRDPLGQAVLDALGDGPLELDALVAAAGSDAPAVFAALTVLELDGRIERSGATSFTRSAMLPK